MTEYEEKLLKEIKDIRGKMEMLEKVPALLHAMHENLDDIRVNTCGYDGYSIAQEVRTLIELVKKDKE